MFCNLVLNLIQMFLCVFLILGITINLVNSRCVQGGNCKLPSCFCSTFEHPLGRGNVPQIVYFAIDGYVNDETATYFNRLFHPTRKNPNKCSIAATLLVSVNRDTNFKILQDFYERGFEVGIKPDGGALSNSTEVEYHAMSDRQLIADALNISTGDIQGWKSPHLKTSGDDQIEVLKRLGYRYDTSKTYFRKKAMKGRNPFPMTTDFRWPFPCNIWPCWRQSHSHFWEVPINSLWDFKQRYPCPTVDGCHNRPSTEKQASTFLMTNFKNSYFGNRAPFGLHMSGQYFRDAVAYRAIDQFIRDILIQPDVYILPINKMLDWLEYPTPLSEVDSYQPWTCSMLSLPTVVLPPLPKIYPKLNPKDCKQGITCKLPQCFCKTFEHPMGRTSIPQIVYFAIDDALDDSVFPYFEELFSENKTNPNGCPVSVTYFVNHHDSNYTLIKHLYSKGMEIGSHSITHGSTTTRDDVFREAKGQRVNIAKFAGVPVQNVRGYRSPFLQTAGDEQAEVLKKLGYEYDISYTFTRRPSNSRNVFPFTADYGWPLPCNIAPCLKRAHKSFWEVPINSMWDYTGKEICAYTDDCRQQPPTRAAVKKYLMDNFNNSYKGNRAPFGIHMHGRWFHESKNLEGMGEFIDHLLTLPDVYIVSVSKMLDWMKYPTQLSQMNVFGLWACTSNEMM